MTRASTDGDGPERYGSPCVRPRGGEVLQLLRSRPRPRPSGSGPVRCMSGQNSAIAVVRAARRLIRPGARRHRRSQRERRARAASIRPMAELPPIRFELRAGAVTALPLAIAVGLFGVSFGVLSATSGGMGAAAGDRHERDHLCRLGAVRGGVGLLGRRAARLTAIAGRAAAQRALRPDRRQRGAVPPRRAAPTVPHASWSSTSRGRSPRRASGRSIPIA